LLGHQQGDHLGRRRRVERRRRRRGARAAAGGAGGAVGGAGGGDGGLSLGGTGGQGGGEPLEVAEVFGHGPDQLYRLDPKTKQITTVGSFSGCEGSIIDLAIDEDGVMVGSTFDALYFIDKATAACTLIAYGSYPNSLSFVPKGTLEPDHEVLVGYVDDEYVRIDTVTGALSTVGYLSNGLASSGDVVSVIDGKTFLTVKGAGLRHRLPRRGEPHDGRSRHRLRRDGLLAGVRPRVLGGLGLRLHQRRRAVRDRARPRWPGHHARAVPERTGGPAVLRGGLVDRRAARAAPGVSGRPLRAPPRLRARA
jgi:hypothetical protein